MQNLDHFKQFLEIERSILLTGGISTNLTKELIEHINQLSQELIIFARSRIVTPEQIFITVENLKDQTCKLARQLRQERIKMDQVEQVKTKLKKVGWAIAGSSLVVLNVSLANQLGLNPGGAALSGILGAIFIDKAAA